MKRSLFRQIGIPWIAIVCCAIAGCQNWHTASGLPGIGLSKQEKRIVEKAIDDPFPSPEQVGMETCSGDCQK